MDGATGSRVVLLVANGSFVGRDRPAESGCQMCYGGVIMQLVFFSPSSRISINNLPLLHYIFYYYVVLVIIGKLFYFHFIIVYQSF